MTLDLLGYKLNKRSFADLAEMLPADVASCLRPLVGNPALSKSNFSNQVEAALGNKLTQQHLAVTLREAKRLQIKRIGRYVESLRTTFFPSTSFTPSLLNYIRLRPLFFSLWFRFRMLRHFGFMVLKKKPLVHKLDRDQKEYITQDVLPYNMSQVAMFLEGHRYRTERIILLLKALCGKHTNTQQVLCVGPRNEAELLLFSLHGFPLKNIVGIDLFSYSPLVHVMDMHDLDFENDTFDIYYSAFTLAYSQDVERASAEAIRVTKDDGLMVITMTVRGVALLTGKPADRAPGARDMLELFAPYVRHVYFQENAEWQQEHMGDDESTYVTAIFSIDKAAGS